jgi:hypothetical protein
MSVTPLTEQEIIKIRELIATDGLVDKVLKRQEYLDNIKQINADRLSERQPIADQLASIDNDKQTLIQSELEKINALGLGNSV